MMLLASDFDKSKYLKGTDLDREKKFRIKTVTSGELTDKKGNKELKLIVWFTNDACGLPLNKTNLRTLRGAFGDDTTGWAAKVIAMFPMMADNNQLGLRIRILPPKQAAVAATATQPASPTPSGNGAAAAAPAPAAVDPELGPDPKMVLTAEQDDELNDEIPEKW